MKGVNTVQDSYHWYQQRQHLNHKRQETMKIRKTTYPSAHPPVNTAEQLHSQTMATRRGHHHSAICQSLCDYRLQETQNSLNPNDVLLPTCFWSPWQTLSSSISLCDDINWNDDDDDDTAAAGNWKTEGVSAPVPPLAQVGFGEDMLWGGFKGPIVTATEPLKIPTKTIMHSRQHYQNYCIKLTIRTLCSCVILTISSITYGIMDNNAHTHTRTRMHSHSIFIAIPHQDLQETINSWSNEITTSECHSLV